MRSILLHAHGDAGFESRLQAALDVARQFDAHLTCLQPISFDVAVPGDFYGSAMAQMVPVVREIAARFRKEIEERLENEDVRWEWIDEAGLGESALLEHASLHDLVVIGATPEEPGRRGPPPLAGKMAIYSRTPLLVVPRETKEFSAETVALVAWNGSPESSRALRAAVPFLARATKVWLATVEEDKAGNTYDMPPLRGAEYLARHGIESEIVELPETGHGIAGTLEQAARVRQAGYVVMGAYGHSRLMETLFGGVTRHMLTKPALPLLLSH